jgi:hypothetical protein
MQRKARDVEFPAGLGAFENILKSIKDFWLTLAKLPTQQESA